MLADAVMSITMNPWLVGDIFTYVCNGDLVVSGQSENQCSESAGNLATWSLSNALGNLPICGRFCVQLHKLLLYFIVRVDLVRLQLLPLRDWHY